MRRLALALVALAAIAGCGDGDPGGGRTELIVSAATSLTAAFDSYARSLGDLEVRYSFAGSDELAAQIRKGVRPDVFASANTKLPDALHREGKLDKPVVFARNRLVIAVPRNSRIDSIDDLAQPGKKLVAGSPTVPIGSYTREVLKRLGGSLDERILRNLRSSEPNVGGVVAKLAAGAGDAGFVYITDIAGANGKLRAVELPPRLQPTVAYAAGVVKGAPHPREARRFIAGLLNGEGLRIMGEAGFEPSPQ